MWYRPSVDDGLLDFDITQVRLKCRVQLQAKRLKPVRKATVSGTCPDTSRRSELNATHAQRTGAGKQPLW